MPRMMSFGAGMGSSRWARSDCHVVSESKTPACGKVDASSFPVLPVRRCPIAPHAGRPIVPLGGIHQSLFRRGQMRPASKIDHGDVAAEQSVDVGEMLMNRNLVALSLVMLVPLIVVVKDQRYDVVE